MGGRGAGRAGGGGGRRRDLRALPGRLAGSPPSEQISKPGPRLQCSDSRHSWADRVYELSKGAFGSILIAHLPSSQSFLAE